MKKNKKAKKLQLEKLTVRKLVTSDLVGVRGGVYADGGGGGCTTCTTVTDGCGTTDTGPVGGSTTACQAGSGL